MLAGGGGVNVNITINGNADPQAIQNAADASFTDFKSAKSDGAD